MKSKFTVYSKNHLQYYSYIYSFDTVMYCAAVRVQRAICESFKVRCVYSDSLQTYVHCTVQLQQTQWTHNRIITEWPSHPNLFTHKCNFFIEINSFLLNLGVTVPTPQPVGKYNILVKFLSFAFKLVFSCYAI